MPALTTDNAKNIMNAGELAGMKPHIGCVAHTINLATQKGLQVPQMEKLLARIRRVVTYFHKSSIGMSYLNNKQTLLELPKHKLIMDVSTRWNSTFDMLERFLEQQPAIEATLMVKDFRDIYTLSEDDVLAAQQVLEVFRPIKTITTILCHEKSPTVSLIHPLKEMLLGQLSRVADHDDLLVTAVKTAIHRNLEPRYSGDDVRLFLLESSCLDPRFKAMLYLSNDEREKVYKSLEEKVMEINSLKTKALDIKVEKVDEEPSNPPLPSLDHPGQTRTVINDDTNAEELEQKPDVVVKSESPANKRKCALDDLFGEVFVTKVEPAKSLKSRVEHEIVNYKCEESMPLDSDPLLWWKVHQKAYPLLAHLAQKYLSIPATSVASERVFSTAGDLVTAQRSCLSCEQVDRLIFLKKNLDINNNN